jgi:fucose 4-O-acetylase-like acetyltransferase
MERDLYYDNLKGLLIILVVLCHFLGCCLTRSDYFLRSFVLFIYLFHMPLFIFVSGYFSKNVEKCRETAFYSLFLVFVFAQIFWVIFKYLTNSSVYYIEHYLDPGYALWYIVALFFWRIFLKDIVKLRHALLISFLISPLIMFLSDSEMTLAINKTIGFLVFFLLGYYASEETIKKIRRLPKSVALILLGLVFAVVTVLLKKNLIVYGTVKNVLMHTQSMDSFPNVWTGLGAYYGVILLAVFCGSLILAVIPGKKTFLSNIGKDTLPLYLSHTYFLILCSMLLAKITLPHVAECIITLAICTTVIIIFSTSIYRRLFHNVYHHLIQWIYPRCCVKKS